MLSARTGRPISGVQVRLGLDLPRVPVNDEAREKEVVDRLEIGKRSRRCSMDELLLASRALRREFQAVRKARRR